MPKTKRRTPVNSSILERAIDKIRRIGNNINLIAHASNLNLPPDSEHLQQVLNEHTKVLKLIGKYCFLLPHKSTIRDEKS